MKNPDAKQLRTPGSAGYDTRPGFVLEHAPRIMAALMTGGEMGIRTAASQSVKAASALFDALYTHMEGYEQ
jgi:hypothetical protein